MPVWTLLVSVVRSREAERRSLLGGYFYIKRMLKSIGAFVFVRSREVVRFWEGPLREAPLQLHVQSTEIIALGVR